MNMIYYNEPKNVQEKFDNFELELNNVSTYKSMICDLVNKYFIDDKGMIDLSMVAEARYRKYRFHSITLHDGNGIRIIIGIEIYNNIYVLQKQTL